MQGVRNENVIHASLFEARAVCCCLKVNLSVSGFLVLQMSHELKVSNISMNFATDFCLKDRFSSQHSNVILKKTLKSQASKGSNFSLCK